MAVSARKPQVFNPATKTRRKKNPVSYLATLGTLNPNSKGKKHMPKQKTKRAKASASTRKNKPMPKRPNPFYKPGKTHSKPGRRPARRSNPDSIKPVDMAKEGAIILSGLIAARQLPQLVLGDKNKDLIGYASNFGVAAVGGLILGMTVSKRLGFSFAAGGAAYTMSRIATEKLSPFGRYFQLSGVGDAAAASLGDVRRAGMGIVVPSSYNEPMLKDAAGNIAIPPHMQAYVSRELAARPMPVAAAATVGRFSR